MKEYQIIIYKQPRKFLEKQQEHIKKRVINWLKKLVLNPYENHDGKVETEFYHGLQAYKKRIGDIRIVFIINDTDIVIEIFKADNRGQVYKN